MNKFFNFVILTSSLILAGCLGSDNKKSAAQQQIPPMPVTVMQAKMGDIPIVLSFNGQTVSDMDVVLKAKVAGTIEKQFFKKWEQVKGHLGQYQVYKHSHYRGPKRSERGKSAKNIFEEIMTKIFQTWKRNK